MTRPRKTTPEDLRTLREIRAALGASPYAELAAIEARYRFHAIGSRIGKPPEALCITFKFPEPHEAEVAVHAFMAQGVPALWVDTYAVVLYRQTPTSEPTAPE